MGVVALFLLSSLGLFAITAQAQQCSKPPGGANMDLRPEYIIQTTFEDGATVAFSCNPGYASAGGSPTITCTAGQWSPVRLRCERKNCGALQDVANGEVIYRDGTEFGDTAKIQCKPGYAPVGGSPVLRCEVEGWAGRLQTCEVECDDPVIENAEFESGSRPPHRLNAVVTYSCKPGYTMEGPSTVTCNLTSQWFPSLPKCKMVKCLPPGGTVNGDFSPVKDVYEYRDVVQYTCNEDFILKGSRELTCSEDGIFSPAPPTCVLVECKEPVIEDAELKSGSRP